MPPPSCDLCGSRNVRNVLTGRDRRHGVEGEFRVVRCAGCGLARTEPVPADLAAVYPEDEYANYGDRADLPSRIFGRVMRGCAGGRWPGPVARAATWLTPAAALGGPLPAGSRVLDVGAGSGHAVAAMRAAGLDAHGMEPSPRAVATAHARGLDTITQGGFEDAELGEAEWDLIRFWHTLEHLREPVGALRRARAALRPGGRVVVGVPNVGGAGGRAFRSAWDGLELPRHLHHFTPGTLRRALVAAGFADARVRSVAIMGVLAGSIDAATRRGDRQRDRAGSTVVQLALHPVELALAAAGAGDGLLAVAAAR